MTDHNSEIGGQLLALLRQQRYLYHQLRILSRTQQQFQAKASPEILLEVSAGRRKLLEKLRQLDNKLRPIKANWQKLSPQIAPEQMATVREMAMHVRNMVREILDFASPQIEQNLPLADSCRFDELFAEPQPQNKE